MTVASGGGGLTPSRLMHLINSTLIVLVPVLQTCPKPPLQLKMEPSSAQVTVAVQPSAIAGVAEAASAETTAGSEIEAPEATS